MLDMFSGLKIAISVSMAQAQNPAMDMTVIGPVIQQYTAWAQSPAAAAPAELRAPNAAQTTAANPMARMVGSIMGGMMIFFAFFTGGATAQSIIQESEGGTLSRLFTTPTPLSTILGGKFLAVGLTVVVQVTLLLVAAALVFQIQWGDPAAGKSE